MVNAEKVFPKEGNDPLYANDVNSLWAYCGSPYYVSAGSSIATIGASSNGNIGSILFGGISRPTNLTISIAYVSSGTRNTTPYIILNSGEVLDGFAQYLGYYQGGGTPLIRTFPVIVENGQSVKFKGYVGGDETISIIGSLKIFGGTSGLTISGTQSL